MVSSFFMPRTPKGDHPDDVAAHRIDGRRVASLNDTRCHPSQFRLLAIMPAFEGMAACKQFLCPDEVEPVFLDVMATFLFIPLELHCRGIRA
jgi:hypothetical protein